MNKMQNINSFVSFNEKRTFTRKNVLLLLFANTFLSFFIGGIIERTIKNSPFHFSYVYVTFLLVMFTVYLLFHFERKKASFYLFEGISLLNVSIMFGSIGLDVVFTKNKQFYRQFSIFYILISLIIIFIILWTADKSISKGSISPIPSLCAMAVGVGISAILHIDFYNSAHDIIDTILPFAGSFLLLFGVLPILKWYYIIRYL